MSYHIDEVIEKETGRTLYMFGAGKYRSLVARYTREAAIEAGEEYLAKTGRGELVEGNLGRALAAAHEYRETAEKYGSNHETCRKLADQIFGYVGRWDYSTLPGGEARRVLPAVVREAMGFHNIQDWRMAP